MQEFWAAVLQGWRAALPFSDLLENRAKLQADGLAQLSTVLYQPWSVLDASTAFAA